MTLHHIPDTKNILTKFHTLLEPNGYLLVADLDKEDGSFHADGSTDVHYGFERSSFQRLVEATGFGNIAFLTTYESKKTINGEDRVFPVFLMTAQKILRERTT